MNSFGGLRYLPSVLKRGSGRSFVLMPEAKARQAMRKKQECQITWFAASLLHPSCYILDHFSNGNSDRG
jgi:hypothetical protein